MRSSSLATWHQFPFIPLFLIVLSIYPIHGLDSANYKFGIVNGAPEMISNASEIIENVASFDECVEKCSQEYTCILAYQANSTDPCYLFQWNSIQQVVKNESGGVGQVAFKVVTDQPSCELNLPFLLNGKIYQLYQNETERYLWKIDTSENGWKITYIDAIPPPPDMICGNWSFNRPYKDSCDSECNVTLVQVWGKPGPITKHTKGKNKTVDTWQECMDLCFSDKRCFVAYFIQGSQNCQLIWAGFIWYITRTTASDGHHLAMKLPMSDQKCKMTTEQLLDDQYYTTGPAMIYYETRLYFRMRTSPKYYKIIWLLDENERFLVFVGCPHLHLGSGTVVATPSNDTICYRFDYQAGISQPDAKELCEGLDMKLLTDKYTGTVPPPGVRRVEPGTPLDNFPKLVGLFGMDPGKELKIWYGLEKDPSDGKWKWSDPSFREFPEDVMPIPWGPGEPKDGPDLTCAYMGYGKSQPAFVGYAFYAAPCNSTEVDGLACGSRQQQFQSHKKWKEVSDEFGVSQISMQEMVKDDAMFTAFRNQWNDEYNTIQ